ncbi:leucine-rich repeat domain-containing protein [Nostoc sp. FACHB-152]|uniref:COR domain-containing protein n=1 Tax=unclassified Nostoc TaxID=2593658 RepID=UPI001688D8C5|nr:MULTISPECIES: COR domain-containing protein [unclassified Nostoc]MBD2449294.1 leucine-rich repeat domain-containing protein [Nostoc sp. FACHB-152]MBD2470428.1 leucine-rich repeat domain-containing protein [Nostoc sp. FACHB-145]
MTNEELLHLIGQANRDKVTELDLSGKGLTKLPAEIGQLVNLRSLDLSDNQLSSLPGEIGQLVNLQSLDLSDNQLSSLPGEIGQLVNLQSLDLRGNQLSSLPGEIGQLVNLQSLDLMSNQLSSLPGEFGQLTHLQKIYIQNNQLSSLPGEIGQLVQLTELRVWGNPLTTLPLTIIQLVNLLTFSFNSNLLKELPREIFELKSLTWLDISGNSTLNVLSDAIVNLTNLERLSLSNSQITTLPPHIGQLTHLKTLNLSSNQLNSLPAEIGQLKSLEILELDNNQLINLPLEIQRLTKLKKLDLRGEGNAKLQIPPEILGSSWDNLGEPAKILNYYFSLQAEQEKPLNEAKVLVVGQGSVGKTSLVKRLIKNLYDSQERKTEGINIQNWQVPINNQSIRLNVWDFGGQEIMHATHQFFLTKRSLYLLVLDARVDERQNELEYWLKIIQSFGGDSPIIIVGNKIDQHTLDLDQKGLRDKYVNIKDIVAVSCAAGDGLEKLRSVITRELANLKHIHDPLPQSWFQVKTCLEQMKEKNIDYISYKEYEDLCTQEQVTGEMNQSTLIELLHRLGIVLNFRGDHRLEDTNVLNPSWVTNGVYKILNDRQLIMEFRGILNREQLKRILDDPCYPRNKQRFIVEMMFKFELCFLLEDGTGDRYLIPDLLPKEEPATGEWENVLAFQYHYNVLPSSIISRFIVRMHHLADKQTWWRSGIVLKEHNNRALVKSDREDRKIFIFISGSQSTRRELLKAIRTQFKAIHKTITGLIAEEKVPIPGHPHIIADYENLLIYEEKNLPYIPPGLTEPFDARQILDGIEPEIKRRERQGDREDKYIDKRPIKGSPTPKSEPEIFISYTLRDKHSENWVQQIEKAFQKEGIKIIRDQNALDYKEKFKEFMQRLSRGKCIVVVISDAYLKSENCMYELVEIAKNGEFYDRIFPVVLEDAKIYKGIERIQYVDYWEQQIADLDEAIKNRKSGAKLKGFQEELNLYSDIRNTFDELTDLLRNMNTLKQDIHSQSGFEALKKAIADRLNE